MVARPDEAPFLRAVPHEERRPLARLLRPGARDGEQRHASGRVVVRAVPDRVAGHGPSDAVVVLMAREEHELVLERGVGTRYNSHDVHRGIHEALAPHIDHRGHPTLVQRLRHGTPNDHHRRPELRSLVRAPRVEAVGAASADRRGEVPRRLRRRVGHEDDRTRSFSGELGRALRHGEARIAHGAQTHVAPGRVGWDQHVRRNDLPLHVQRVEARAHGVPDPRDRALHARINDAWHDRLRPHGEARTPDRHRRRRPHAHAAESPPLEV